MILITGGAGFIGSSLALRLIELGFKVKIVDNLSPQIHGHDPEKSYTYNLIKDKVEFIKGDLTLKHTWISALEDVSCIIHLASETGTGQSMYEIEKYVNVNSGATAIMLDVLSNHKNKVHKIILASSRAVYGEGKYLCPKHGFVFPDSRFPEDMLKCDFECKCPVCRSIIKVIPTDENSAIKPGSVYAVTKFNQEQLISIVSKSLGIQSIIFRFQNVYGPGQSLKNPYTGVLSVFSCLFRQDREINIFEDGLESRDFVYIGDVVNAIILGIKEKSVENHILNVGSGNPVTIFDVAMILKDHLKSNSRIKITGNFRIGDIRSNYGDISKISSLIGYSPETSINLGIQKFAEWVKTQEKENLGYDKSLDELKIRNLLK